MTKEEKQAGFTGKNFVKTAIRIFMALVGLGIGPALVAVAATFAERADLWYFSQLIWWARLLLFTVPGVITCVVFILLTPRFFNRLERWERRLQAMPAADVVSGAIGLLVGLLIAFLLSQLTNRIPVAGLILSILLYLVLGYIGLSVGIRRREELAAMMDIRSKLPGRRSKQETAGLESGDASPKVLDTSVIIDGRIYDIAKTGFLEGPIWVPRFVLTELRHIADSPDLLKRNRGRRGLDVLAQMQKELPLSVEVPDNDYEDIPEVDQKLLHLAKEAGGMVVTNDFNLNKVAGVQGVRVLNINELANAVKPVALPGEEMAITVVKEGKEAGQGVGFLPDGTMVVVENGNRLQGMTIDVVVTSSLQTAAGRMVFGRPKDD